MKVDLGKSLATPIRKSFEGTLMVALEESMKVHLFDSAIGFVWSELSCELFFPLEGALRRGIAGDIEDWRNQ
jgi:hypothetical protein